MNDHLRSRRGERGVTLLEALMSLTVLLVGIVGMMQLQIVGITADAGARSHTQAWQLARDLAAGLERLDVLDPLLDPHANTPAPPAGFGHALLPSGEIATDGATVWDDAAPVPGVAATDEWILERFGGDPIDPDLPLFQRRWSVWQSQTAATEGGVKLIAVSVVYREKALTGAREVVLLTQVSNPGLSSAFASAYR
jgi:type IV pilus assembly protein PilV